MLISNQPVWQFQLRPLLTGAYNQAYGCAITNILSIIWCIYSVLAWLAHRGVKNWKRGKSKGETQLHINIPFCSGVHKPRTM